MTCQAMPRTRQPAMPAPGRPARARRDAASGTVSSDVPGTPAVLSVPWWGMVSAVVAPVLLISGWTFAAGRQRGTYNAVADTVSALAAEGAADRWVMTIAFLLAGAFEVVTGLSLRPAAAAGRLILMAGGVAGLLVAASPEPAGRRVSTAYVGSGGRPGRPGRLAGRSPAAGTFGAVGPAAGCVGRRFGGPARRPAVVRRGTPHQRRAGGPGRAAAGRPADTLAGAGDPFVPPEPARHSAAGASGQPGQPGQNSGSRRRRSRSNRRKSNEYR